MNTVDTFRPQAAMLIFLGAITGMLSGVFGIGGGVVLVPLLVLILNFPQRLAAGTSVAAILPAAVTAGATYALQGNVDWVVAGCLAVGMVFGAQIGSYLLVRVNTSVLRVLFVVFLVVVIAMLWVVVPERSDRVELSIFTMILLVLTGLIVGTVSGLLGVGGGVIVVPTLMFFYGANDLDAKGSSLLMMIPGSLSGTISNFARKTVDVRSALFVGIVAAAFSPFGSIVATLISPLASNAAFSVLLVFIAVQMVLKMRKERRAAA